MSGKFHPTLLILASTAAVLHFALAPGLAAETTPGEAIYKQTCIACHGENGAGALPGVASFNRKDGPLSKPDAVLLKHMADGFQSPGSPMAMPAKGGNPSLTKSDLQRVLLYLRQRFGAPSAKR